MGDIFSLHVLISQVLLSFYHNILSAIWRQGDDFKLVLKLKDEQ